MQRGIAGLQRYRPPGRGRPCRRLGRGTGLGLSALPGLSRLVGSLGRKMKRQDDTSLKHHPSYPLAQGGRGTGPL